MIKVEYKKIRTNLQTMSTGRTREVNGRTSGNRSGSKSEAKSWRISREREKRKK